MEKNSKMFLKRSAYHISKARDLKSALQKSKGVEEALNRLKDIQADYQREALIAANKAMAKNYGFSSLKKLVDFMSEMAELPDDKKEQIIRIVNPQLIQSDTTINDNNGANNQDTEQGEQNPAPIPPSDMNNQNSDTNMTNK